MESGLVTAHSDQNRHVDTETTSTSEFVAHALNLV